MDKKKKTLLWALIALVVVAGIFAGVYFANKPKAQAGQKNITLELVGKETSREVKVQTDAEYLGTVLIDEGLVEGQQSDYGLYITAVDGYTADESAQEWWCITKGGEQVDTGADTTPIADGDTFELTLKTGW